MGQGNGGESIQAAGVVVFHPDVSSGRRFLAVHRPHRGDWSLPKGKVDPGETTACAAVRECDEETGYRVSLAARLPSLSYRAGGQTKIVDYWIGRVRADEGFAPDDEVDEIRWIKLTEADEILTYSDDAMLVKIAAEAPETTPLIVLRHAKAMRRADFDGGDDAERPLSGRGRSEAKQLAEVLDAFGIQGIHSSPFKRCMSSVARYAKATGIHVVGEPSLTEFDHESDPSAAARRIVELLHQPTPMVVCTHRPVLPTVFAALAEALGLPPSVVGEDPDWDARLAPGAMLILHREWTARGPRLFAVEQLQLPRR